MQSYDWLMYAAMAVWAGIGIYAALLGRRQAALSRRLERMAAREESDHGK